MNDHILIPRPAAVPTPAELVGYLLQRGWQRTSGDDAWLQLARADDPDSVVEVPQRSLAPDYPRAAHTLLDDLSRLEGRPAAAILRDVKSVALDCVRIAVESDATRDGRIGVEAGRRVYAAARDLYLAAACAVDEPRPAFPRRKTSAVMDTLERARFGQTEVGSFVLTIESEIPQRLRGEDPQDDEAPRERQTNMLLAKALAGASAAVREAAVTPSLAPFQRMVAQGVSANLCDAVAEILEATQAHALRASFAFASRWPLHADVPRQVAFAFDAAGQLREAAKGLREAATFEGLKVQGHVVRLDRPPVAEAGRVTVHTEVDGTWRHVAIELGHEDYQRAIDAHRGGTFVQCVGDLRKVGRTWQLEHPREFMKVEER